MTMRLLLIAAFGLLGVFLRYALGLLAARYFSAAFPYSTFGINLVGAFCIGIIYVVAVEHAAISDNLRTAIIVGFLGSFTTFSAYCLEAVHLFEKPGQLGTALLYVLLSPALGLSATYAGLLVARFGMQIFF